MKIVQYTVNIGNYDKPRTDGIICFDKINLFSNDARNSRLPKILAHKYIDADVSVYWDCNIYLKDGLIIENVVNDYLADCDIVVQRCSVGRDCVYQEIQAAKTRVIDEEIKALDKQAKHYKSIGFPEHCKTLAGYQPLIRKHSLLMEAFNNAWWAEICKFSYRDQCSFPVILSRFPELKVKWVDNLGELTQREYRHKSTR